MAVRRVWVAVAMLCATGDLTNADAALRAEEADADSATPTIVLQGDIHVRDRVLWREAHYQIHGNVVLHDGGELVIEDATVELMCTYAREFRYQWEGGRLRTRNVTIGGSRRDGIVQSTYFEVQHGVWEAVDTTIQYSSGVAMGWQGHDVKLHATRLQAGPHPDSIIMSAGRADVVLKDSEFNISLAVSAQKGGSGRLELPVREPVTRVFDSSNLPGIAYRLELINTQVDLWWVFFSGIRHGGPTTEIELGECPRLIPSILAYDLQGPLQLPAPWPESPEAQTDLNIGNLTLRTTGENVRTWCWGLYLGGPRTDVTLSGATCICELFLNEGRLVMAGDEGTHNGRNACTTVEVGRRQGIAVPDDAPQAASGESPHAELVMRHVALGRFAANDEVIGQITAHRGGRILIEHARCARLKLMTKQDGTIHLSDLACEGELERIEQGGPITLE